MVLSGLTKVKIGGLAREAGISLPVRHRFTLTALPENVGKAEGNGGGEHGGSLQGKLDAKLKKWLPWNN